jgi:hypothetical protein
MDEKKQSQDYNKLSLLSVTSAAKLIKKDKYFVTGLIESGYLTSREINGKTLILYEHLDSFMKWWYSESFPGLTIKVIKDRIPKKELEANKQRKKKKFLSKPDESNASIKKEILTYVLPASDKRVLSAEAEDAIESTCGKDKANELSRKLLEKAFKPRQKNQ